MVNNHIKIIHLTNYRNQHISYLYITISSSIRDIVLKGLQLLNLPPDGNYSIILHIGQYQMNSIDIADHWYHSMSNLGVLGYLTRGNDGSSVNDRNDIWASLDQAKLEIIPMTLRTQSKIHHSYIKLSSGRKLGSDRIKN